MDQYIFPLPEKCTGIEIASIIFEYLFKNASMKEDKTMINDEKKRR
jgi:hypothetical protein